MANYSDIKYQAAGSATAIYADMAALIAATGMSAGDQALVTALNKVFMYTGTAWYLVATMTNASPTAITGVSGSYGLATDGTATTITAVSTDPEGFALTWSYAVTTGSLGSTATVSQADNVFTITPSSTPADAGSFSITFSVTDGATGAVNAVSAFTLQFSVTNSRYTSLLLKATTTGLQTFDDASTSNHTITVAGNSTASTFSPYRHGGYSLGLDGTNDYITIPQTTDTDLTGDFTVECWAYFNDTAGGSGLMGKWGGSGLFGWNLYATATDFWFYTGNSGAPATQGAFTFGSPVVNQWYYLAVSRTGSTISTYVNGTRTTTITDSNNCTANTTLTIGSDGSSLSAWSVDGYMRDVRIVNGTGLYTGASFTVPTEPLTAITNTKFLLGDLPYFKDQSTSNRAITVGGNASLKPKSVFDNYPYSEADHGASVYFDGSGDYLSFPDSVDWDFGTGDFTVEGWVNPAPDLAADTQFIGFGDGGNGGGNFGFEGTGQPYVYHNGYFARTSTALTLGSWSHIAFVRSSGTLSCYINGTSQASSSYTGNVGGTMAPRIGAYSGGQYFKGHMSDVRVVKGTAVYTSNFTLPTAPLTAITNTTLLLNPEPAIIDLAQKFHIDGMGLTGPEGSTTQVAIAGTKSIMHTDSSTAYGVYIRGYSPEFRLNSTFTLEFWAYLSNWNQDTHFYETYGGTNNSFDNATGTETRIGIIGSQLTHRNNYGTNAYAGNYFKQNTDYSNLVYHASNYGITFDNFQWHHWAITQDDSGNCKWYLDGTQIWSYTISLPIAITNTSNYRVRSTAWGNNSSPGPAYIQDYRLTRGLIRYTSNFTPPTAELEG